MTVKAFRATALGQRRGLVRDLALTVTVATSADFVTPIGSQTDLLVYGPGGYRFTDYVHVGAPPQLLLSVTSTLGIAPLWGCRVT